MTIKELKKMMEKYKDEAVAKIPQLQEAQPLIGLMRKPLPKRQENPHKSWRC